MSETWTDEQIYQYAMDHAKARAKEHWLNWAIDPTSANMWKTYNTVLNPNWRDPWYESELYGNTNVAPSGNVEGFHMAQNMYMVYCYLKNKGWQTYAITALLASNQVESTVSGGAWQSTMHPYYDIVGYDSTYVTGMEGYQTWANAGGAIPGSTALFLDKSDHTMYRKQRPRGSWAAVKMWEIKTIRGDDGYYHPYIVNGVIQWDKSQNGQGYYFRDNNVGYGLVQWTPFGVLISHAGLTVPTYGRQHWQLNLTLQLMVLEFERQCAMDASPDDQWSGPGHPYYGEWQDASAAVGFFTYQGNRVSYGSPMTWNDWCSDAFVQWAFDKCDELGITDPEARDWAARMTGMSMFGWAYLHNQYVDHGFQSSTLWIKKAIEYWDSHGGGDIKDVPRPRDIPYSELDQYHISQGEIMAAISGKRRVKKVVTLLL